MWSVGKVLSDDDGKLLLRCEADDGRLMAGQTFQIPSQLTLPFDETLHWSSVGDLSQIDLNEASLLKVLRERLIQGELMCESA